MSAYQSHLVTPLCLNEESPIVHRNHTTQRLNPEIQRFDISNCTSEVSPQQEQKTESLFYRRIHHSSVEVQKAGIRSDIP
jgi:hypothetical protein